MVVRSRSSLRYSVRPRQQPPEPDKPIYKRRTRVDSSDQSDHDDVLAQPRRIPNSKSLPNLQERLHKRPRLSPPSPKRPRCVLSRPPLAVHQAQLPPGISTNDQHDRNNRRPVKIVRRPTLTKLPLHSRDSPDPLNTISSPDRPSSHTTFTSVEATSPRRSTRRTAPVIIANDAGPNGAGSLMTGDATHGEVADPAIVGQTKRVDAAPAPAERRSLRSLDGGSRSKSELAMYFPNYEQMISLDPPKAEFLSPDTTVVLLDDLTESPLPPSPVSSPSKTRKRRKSASQDAESPFGNPLVHLHACEVIKLPEADTASEQDPLGAEVYFKAHRRNERQEKQLRNIERERAQHEKIQLDRLLDELQGHDWLRVMGISGITDTEKKLYEPKRDFFIKEVSALIDKFRVWKEEEKRRKLEREQMLAEAAASAAENEDQEDGIEEAEEEEDEQEAEEEQQQEEETVEDAQPATSDVQSYGEPPDINDVDALAAHQLLQEARSASAAPRRRLVDELSGSPPPPPRPQEPFVSFYSKRYLRDAAIGGHRRGRSRTAFGHPVPELEEREFQLPDDILTPEVLDSINRRRRRLKRESGG